MKMGPERGFGAGIESKAAVEKEESLFPVASMEISLGKGGISIANSEGVNPFREDEMRLGKFIVEDIKKHLDEDPRFSSAAEKLEARNENILPFWFRQPFGIVIREIVMNAIRAVRLGGESNGQISVKTEIDEARKSLIISISDNGMGLEGHDPKTLFKEGYTTKKDEPFAETVGNGLSRSKAFVEKVLNGKIELLDNAKTAQRRPQGATCVITIPL